MRLQDSPLSKSLRFAQISFSVLLLWGFFQPWSNGLGGSATALQLQNRLSGPHKLTSFLKRESRISRDYRLSGQIWILGITEGAALASSFIPTLTAFPGLISGLVATGTAWNADKAMEHYPFQKKGRGVGITFWAGAALTMVSLLRLFANRIKKPAQ